MLIKKCFKEGFRVVFYQRVHTIFRARATITQCARDAVDTTTTSKDPMSGVARRSLTIGQLELSNRTVPIRLARVQAPGGKVGRDVLPQPRGLGGVALLPAARKGGSYHLKQRNGHGTILTGVHRLGRHGPLIRRL